MRRNFQNQGTPSSKTRPTKINTTNITFSKPNPALSNSNTSNTSNTSTHTLTSGDKKNNNLSKPITPRTRTLNLKKNMNPPYPEKNLNFKMGGKKKLPPINNLNSSVTSTSTKESIKEKEIMNSSRERFEIECTSDKKQDEAYLAGLSESEKFFYEVKAKDIYNFLKSINLIRFIESFINDGFETKEDLMEIKEDYFEENKNFNKTQQKKILAKAKEYLDEFLKNNPGYNPDENFNINEINKDINSLNVSNDNLSKSKNSNINNLFNNSNNNIKRFNEIAVGGEDNIKDYPMLFNSISFNRCWTCFKKLQDDKYIEKNYEGSIVSKKVRFCSEKCMENFEKDMFAYCVNCGVSFDKSKGDFIYDNKHFHSQQCLDNYLSVVLPDYQIEKEMKKKSMKRNISKKNYKEDFNKGSENRIENRSDYSNKRYDPMEDF